MEIIVQNRDILIMLAIGFGLFMAWGIGANDVANAMGTSVGSGAITFKQAVIIAVIFEFAGAVLAGGEVTATVRKGILDAGAFANNPELLVYGMLASLLAAATWLLIASSLGWPVSTTHSIVGAIVGFGAVGVGIEAVSWDKVYAIIASWVVSPLIAGTMAIMIFKSLQRLVIDTEQPLENAKKYLPFYVFFVGFVLSLVTLLKGLKHVDSLKHLGKDLPTSMMIATLVGILAAIIAAIIIRRIKTNPEDDNEFSYANMEKLFGGLMVITACSMGLCSWIK